MILGIDILFNWIFFWFDYQPLTVCSLSPASPPLTRPLISANWWRVWRSFTDHTSRPRTTLKKTWNWVAAGKCDISRKFIPPRQELVPLCSYARTIMRVCSYHHARMLVCSKRYARMLVSLFSYRHVRMLLQLCSYVLCSQAHTVMLVKLVQLCFI